MLKDNLKTLRKIYQSFRVNIRKCQTATSIASSVSKWETGEAYPTMTNLQVICSVLNCKITDLLDAESDDLNNFSEKDRKDISLLKEKDRNRLRKISKIKALNLKQKMEHMELQIGCKKMKYPKY